MPWRFWQVVLDDDGLHGHVARWAQGSASGTAPLAVRQELEAWQVPGSRNPAPAILLPRFAPQLPRQQPQPLVFSLRFALVPGRRTRRLFHLGDAAPVSAAAADLRRAASSSLCMFSNRSSNSLHDMNWQSGRSLSRSSFSSLVTLRRAARPLLLLLSLPQEGGHQVVVSRDVLAPLPATELAHDMSTCARQLDLHVVIIELTESPLMSVSASWSYSIP